MVVISFEDTSLTTVVLKGGILEGMLVVVGMLVVELDNEGIDVVVVVPKPSIEEKVSKNELLEDALLFVVVS